MKRRHGMMDGVYHLLISLSLLGVSAIGPATVFAQDNCMCDGCKRPCNDIKSLGHYKGCKYGNQGSTSSLPAGGGQDFKMQMLQDLVGAAFAALLAPTDNSKQEQLDKQKQLADEQARQKALQEWQKRQAEGDLKKKMDDADRIKQGEKMLSQMQTVGGGLQPFSMGNPKLDIKPISQSTYPTARFNTGDRLLCSAYFSNLAKKSTKDIEARFYADQAQKVMSGEPTDIECRMPHASSEQTAKRMDAVNKLYETMRVKINDLRDVDRQIQESEDKIKKAKVKKEEATAKLNEIQNHTAPVEPEEKAKEDDLEKLALEQLQAADQEISLAQLAEKDGLNKKEQLEKEYENMQSQMKSNIRDSK
jgi:hypothetical protein